VNDYKRKTTKGGREGSEIKDRKEKKGTTRKERR
jgi:hypothetical protein